MINILEVYSRVCLSAPVFLMAMQSCTTRRMFDRIKYRVVTSRHLRSSKRHFWQYSKYSLQTNSLWAQSRRRHTFSMYHLSPAKSSSLWARAHHVTGTTKSHYVPITTYSLVRWHVRLCSLQRRITRVRVDDAT